MFFIVPTTGEQPASTFTSTEGTDHITSHGKTQSQDLAQGDLTLTHDRRRTPKACSRCRLKKTRCSGGKICERCKRDGAVCVTIDNARRGNHTQKPEYIQLVESQRDQLVLALRQVLRNESTTDSDRLKSTLARMGISVDHLRSQTQPRQDTDDLGSESASRSTMSELPQLQDDHPGSPDALRTFETDILDMLSSQMDEAINSSAFHRSGLGPSADASSLGRDFGTPTNDIHQFFDFDLVGNNSPLPYPDDDYAHDRVLHTSDQPHWRSIQ